MKIAVASEGKNISEHFGFCENFNIYHVEDKKVTKVESIANPGHKPGFLPNFLDDLGIKVIISGGMGGGAVEIFRERKIKVITGVKGEATEAVEQYLKDQLIYSGSICKDHDHHS